MNEAMYYLEMAEIAVDKANIVYESFEAYDILSERSSAIREYVEGGLDEVYDEAAATATVEKKKSLLGKAYDAVISLLATIRDKVFGVISKVSGKDKMLVKVPAQYADKKNLSLLDNIIGKIKGFTATTPGKVVTAIAALIASLLAAFGLYKGGKKILMTVKEAKAVSKTYEKHTSILHKFTQSLKSGHLNVIENSKKATAGKKIDASIQSQIDRRSAKRDDVNNLVFVDADAKYKGMKKNVEDTSAVLNKAAKELNAAMSKAVMVENASGGYDFVSPEAKALLDQQAKKNAEAIAKLNKPKEFKKNVRNHSDAAELGGMVIAANNPATTSATDTAKSNPYNPVKRTARDLMDPKKNPGVRPASDDFLDEGPMEDWKPCRLFS